MFVRLFISFICAVSSFHRLACDAKECPVHKNKSLGSGERTCAVYSDCFGRDLRKVPPLSPNVTCLDLSKNGINKLNVGQFKESISLLWLKLWWNAIMILDPGVFQGLKSLESLNLRNNGIRKLVPGVFQELNSLEYLNLADNEIKDIKFGVFRGLKSLRTLVLRGNQISNPNPAMFEGLKSLKHLNLGLNGIKTLTSGVFISLTSLTTLNLAWNRISELDGGIFRGMCSMKKWDFRKNVGLKCSCSMAKELERIRRSNHSVTVHGKCTASHIYGTRNMENLTSTSLNCECGNSTLDGQKCLSNVFGGTSAVYGDFPWQVNVKSRKKTNGDFEDCGGSLLDKNWVLTAAHCVHEKGELNKDVIVHLGLHNKSMKRDKRVQSRNISQVIIYDGFDDRSGKNDLALLRMERSISITKYIRPICLPRGDRLLNLESKTGSIAAGWGVVNKTEIPAETLQMACINLVKWRECENCAWVPPAGQKFLCALGTKTDTTRGDSGGGLIYFHPPDEKWILRAVVSAGLSGFCSKKYSLYTRITSSVLEWIDQKMTSAR